MTFRNSFPFVIAKKSNHSPVPVYFRAFKKWLESPRDAAHLTEEDSDRIMEKLIAHDPEPEDFYYTRIRFDVALRLYREQFLERRGDTRSLPGPDEAGVPMLTARLPQKG